MGSTLLEGIYPLVMVDFGIKPIVGSFGIWGACGEFTTALIKALQNTSNDLDLYERRQDLNNQPTPVVGISRWLVRRFW